MNGHQIVLFRSSGQDEIQTRRPSCAAGRGAASGGVVRQGGAQRSVEQRIFHTLPLRAAERSGALPANAHIDRPSCSRLETCRLWDEIQKRNSPQKDDGQTLVGPDEDDQTCHRRLNLVPQSSYRGLSVV